MHLCEWKEAERFPHRVERYQRPPWCHQVQQIGDNMCYTLLLRTDSKV